MHKDLNAITFADLIHFEYVGAGTYRDARVPKGTNAPVIRGQDLMDLIKGEIERQVVTPPRKSEIRRRMAAGFDY